MSAEYSDANGEGWYAVIQNNVVSAAAHLSVYGRGNNAGHTLWKIRHPMLRTMTSPSVLGLLLNKIALRAAQIRPKSAKLVMFLGELEDTAIQQAERSAFALEGRFRDYYRLGEDCLVYGRTVAYQQYGVSQ